MTDDELKRLSDIRNFDIKKSTIGHNRTWKKDTIKHFKKIINDDMKNDLVSVKSYKTRPL